MSHIESISPARLFSINIFSSKLSIMCRMSWLMLFSDRTDAGTQFHEIGPLYLIRNCFIPVFTDSKRQYVDDLVQ